nr:hypothetical protein [Metamycoplasma orale]
MPTNNAFQLKILIAKNNTSVNQSKTLLTLKETRNIKSAIIKDLK